MEYKTLQDIPRPIRSFFEEVITRTPTGVWEDSGETYLDSDGLEKPVRKEVYLESVSYEVKSRPEKVVTSDLERVSSKGKSLEVLTLFATNIVKYEPWFFFDEYVSWLQECSEIQSANDALLPDEEGVMPLPQPYPLEPLEEEYPTVDTLLKPYVVSFKKQERGVLVSELTVEVDGMVFDGDETSQDRMNRAITSLSGTTETVVWVLANNTAVEVNKTVLKKALRLAGQAQTDIWLMPY